MGTKILTSLYGVVQETLTRFGEKRPLWSSKITDKSTGSGSHFEAAPLCCTPIQNQRTVAETKESVVEVTPRQDLNECTSVYVVVQQKSLRFGDGYSVTRATKKTTENSSSRDGTAPLLSTPIRNQRTVVEKEMHVQLEQDCMSCESQGPENVFVFILLRPADKLSLLREADPCTKSSRQEFHGCPPKPSAPCFCHPIEIASRNPKPSSLPILEFSAQPNSDTGQLSPEMNDRQTISLKEISETPSKPISSTGSESSMTGSESRASVSETRSTSASLSHSSPSSVSHGSSMASLASYCPDDSSGTVLNGSMANIEVDAVQGHKHRASLVEKFLKSPRTTQRELLKSDRNLFQSPQLTTRGTDT
eukprot:gb/GEZN01005194.1/.p1 GENE.gb/GEZN01005194.1/~~gb/GEZN01005194.1/.p1  ORF type:complete len:363 (-),score=7.26 gb/GEZN01005194.1/:664-1752(-)